MVEESRNTVGHSINTTRTIYNTNELSQESIQEGFELEAIAIRLER